MPSTSFVDLAGIATGGTPRMGQTPRSVYTNSKSSSHAKVNLSSQPLKVGHQRVNIDVDLARNRIEGFTEITIFPFSNNLRLIKLDCREMRIKDVYVNNSRNTNYIHNDTLYINDETYFDEYVETGMISIFDLYSDEFSIHQHHLIRQKLNHVFGEMNIDPEYLAAEGSSIGNTEELQIMLPENLKFELTDVNTFHTPGSHPSTLTPLHLKSKNTSGDVYTPIQLKIEYELINPKNGVNFVTNRTADKRNWHAYTMNSSFNIATSSWVPCIDNLWDRCTWSLEINIPRTVRDIGNPRIIGSVEAMKGYKNKLKKRRITGSNGEDEDMEDDEDDDDDDDEDNENYDLVVCSGDFNNVKETPHSIDLSKKVVSWSIFNPVCAHHVGWALGSFQSFVITDSADVNRETEEEAKAAEQLFDDLDKDGASSPITIYCLPDQLEMARNTTIFAKKAIDFYSKEFGSFPFSSYGMTFVQDSPSDSFNFAGLSIFSDKLLYPADIIEPMLTSTEITLEAIACQWSGINIVPQSFNDLWCTIGIAKFMSFQYLKELMGVNEYRFKIKRMMNKIVSDDIGKKPIGAHYFRFPISDSDLTFLKLKAPVVLFILDKRMTKTDKSFGLSRVLPKLFLQAMSGDLQNGTLSTNHFQYVCEKVNRNKLETFFKQWVFGIGAPIFTITQRFNKKRMLIEMSIRQVQNQETKRRRPDSESFINDAIAYLDEEPTFPVQPVFTGPMTIRVHEADGTPYEHIVDLKDGHTKLDVQYNSKFRRLKKNREQMNENAVTFSKLGDVLESDNEMQEWRLVDWTKEEEDPMNMDAFEWIRVDVDFEWIAKFDVRQPDYMYGSQLSNDRDVEAQFEAVRFFGEMEKPQAVHCTALTRTIMDSRYYYGVRIAAAEALGRLSNSKNNFLGVTYLLKVYRELFCFPGSTVPLSNDFNDFGNFFLQKAIPRILCKVRDDNDEVLSPIRNLILNLIKFNDNSNNSFQDSIYMAELVEILTSSAVHSSLPTTFRDPMGLGEAEDDDISPEKRKFIQSVITEINRVQRLDQWIPSYQNVVSVACLSQKIRLASHGYLRLSFEELLYFTLDNYPIDVRVEAFRGLFVLGGLKNAKVLQYFLKTCLLNIESAKFRSKLITALVQSICTAAIGGTPSMLDDPEFKTLEKFSENAKLGTGLNTMVIVEDSNNNEMDTKRDVIARETIKGAIDVLRRDYAVGKGLKNILWELIHTSLLSIYEKRTLFSICQVLYKEIDSFIVKLPIPSVPLNELKKKIVLKNLGNGQVIIKREGRFKIQLASRKIIIPPLEKPKAKEVKDVQKDILESPHKKTAGKTENKPIVIPDKPAKVETPKLTLNLSMKPVAPPVVAEPPKKGKKVQPKKPIPPPTPLVSIIAHNTKRFEIAFKFKTKKLPILPKAPTSKSVKVGRSQVSINGSEIKFSFKGAYKSKFKEVRRNTNAEPIEILGDDDVLVKAPIDIPRYVKILTKEKKVYISSQPFPEPSKPIKVKSETKDSLRIPRPSHVKDIDSSSAAPEESSGSIDKTKGTHGVKLENASNGVDKTSQKSRNLSREPELKIKEKEKSSPFTREASPFSATSSPHGNIKKKKTKIYIHSGDNSKSHSPPLDKSSGGGSNKSEQEDSHSPGKSEETAESTANDDKGSTESKDIAGTHDSASTDSQDSRESIATAPKPKLKLKLSLKK
ncbi:uncharacterized protein RJT20DRAFT_126034 [Scheffersomyces xylosifermentans]|uniref:uncharacterized protein n=1 Tax=Scheffersomyces xylosifermentans TaxID=1304137 RepID=UPI00315DDDCB